MGFKILNFHIVWGFQKTEYFWGYEDFVFCGIFLGEGGGGSSQIGLYLEVISMHFRVFSESQGTEWRMFLVAKNSNIYSGCLKFFIFCEW